MADSTHLASTRWQPGQSGNPLGNALDHHSTKRLSSWLDELLNDEEFTVENFEFAGRKYKGAPIKAIITVAISNALQGDVHWAEWLAKYWTNTKEGESGATTNINFINIVGRAGSQLPPQREAEQIPSE